MTSSATEAVRARIRACVATAEHETTGEGERAAAWAAAERLCAKHGLRLDEFKSPARPFDMDAFERQWRARFGTEFRTAADQKRGSGAGFRGFRTESTPGVDPRGFRGRHHSSGAWFAEAEDLFGSEAAAEFMRRHFEYPPGGRAEDPHEARARQRDAETRRAARRKLESAARFLGAMEGIHVGDQTGRWLIPNRGRWASAAEVIQTAERLGWSEAMMDLGPWTDALVAGASLFLRAERSQTTELPGRWFYRGHPYSAEQLILIALREGWNPGGA